MRKEFISTLVRLAETDPKIILLTADLGYGNLEPFQEKFPDRFINVGVAEQSMIGIATGLAAVGFIPFCYSIATFAFIRSWEFLRNGPIAQNLPVRVVGVGTGIDYHADGISHYGIDDLALSLPYNDLDIITPRSSAEAKKLLESEYNSLKPIFFRLQRSDVRDEFKDKVLSSDVERFDINLISLGTAFQRSLELAEILKTSNFSLRFTNVQHFKELEYIEFKDTIKSSRVNVISEEHIHPGGLGTRIFNIVNDVDYCRTQFVFDGLRPFKTGTVGSREFMLDKLYADKKEIISKILVGLE